MLHRSPTTDFSQFQKPLSPFARFCICRLFPLPFITIGAFFIYFQTSSYYRAHQSESWPQATGVVHIERGEYRRTVTYRYTANGTEYSSDHVIFGELGDRNHSREWNSISELPDGAKVDVYYMPQNPAVSTLFTRVREGGWFNLLFGSVFLFSGIILLIGLPRLLNRIAEQAVGCNRRQRPT